MEAGQNTFGSPCLTPYSIVPKHIVVPKHITLHDAAFCCAMQNTLESLACAYRSVPLYL